MINIEITGCPNCNIPFSFNNRFITCLQCNITFSVDNKMQLWMFKLNNIPRYIYQEYLGYLFKKFSNGDKVIWTPDTCKINYDIIDYMLPFDITEEQLSLYKILS